MRVGAFLFLLFGDFTGQFRGTVAAPSGVLNEITLFLCHLTLCRSSLPGRGAQNLQWKREQPLFPSRQSSTVASLDFLPRLSAERQARLSSNSG